MLSTLYRAEQDEASRLRLSEMQLAVGIFRCFV